MRPALLRSIRGLALISIATSAILPACGISSKRDMSVPPKELTFADACGLQEYFDQRATAGLTAPQAADEMLATNEKGQTVGEGTYVLKDPLARRRFGRLLREEYGGIESKIIHGVEGVDGRVTVHLRWWDAGPVKRARPDGEIYVDTPNGKEELPPNPCVSDFLFGDKLYAMRARYLRNEVDLATDHSSAPPPPAETETASATVAPSSSAPPAAPVAPTASAASSK